MESVSNRGISQPLAADPGSTPNAHPLLAKLKILPVDITTLEDFNEHPVLTDKKWGEYSCTH